MKRHQADWHLYRLTVMALRHYPTSTKELTLALHLGKGGLATFGMIKVRERRPSPSTAPSSEQRTP